MEHKALVATSMNMSSKIRVKKLQKMGGGVWERSTPLRNIKRPAKNVKCLETELNICAHEPKKNHFCLKSVNTLLNRTNAPNRSYENGIFVIDTLIKRTKFCLHVKLILKWLLVSSKCIITCIITPYNSFTSLLFWKGYFYLVMNSTRIK